MADPITDPTGSGLLAWFGALLLALLGWFGRRQLARIDKLESESIAKTEYNDTIKSLREEIRSGHEKTQTLIIDLYKRQSGGG